jgi:hypothetical protein
MKIAFSLPQRRPDGTAQTVEEIASIAATIEAAGFDGIWIGDAVARGRMFSDPFLWLLAAAAGTKHVDLGIAVYQTPLRRPVELAQRVLTMHALTNGRFMFGAVVSQVLRGLDPLDRVFRAAAQREARVVRKRFRRRLLRQTDANRRDDRPLAAESAVFLQALAHVPEGRAARPTAGRQPAVELLRGAADPDLARPRADHDRRAGDRVRPRFQLRVADALAPAQPGDRVEVAR